ncbi:hypothetical protein Bca4012_055234 [Brassica carinata]|uniref:C2H2-type domain-containing protein n=1 Tax=Brassica carinata TaxID=52824 RepID=A0A8X7VUS2_BRACI|nr:hypothetical protein Bca52824_011771 [Brassica carinata]
MTVTSNAIITIFPNPNLQLSLSPSYYQYQSAGKKRTKTVALSSISSLKSTPKPKYSSKPDPNAPKITSPCNECGKKFWSLKALFGHIRCHPVSTRTQVRSHFCPRKNIIIVASYLLMPSYATPSLLSSVDRFECGGCKKVFGSHQAFGGHRASHENAKGCFEIIKVTDDPMTVTTTSSDQDHQGKIATFSGHHKSSILRSHMRCHWEKEGETMFGSALDLNVLARTHDLSISDTSGCSLDLRLRLYLLYIVVHWIVCL